MREQEPRVVHFRSPAVYHSLISINGFPIVERPSRPGHKLLVFGKAVYGTGCLAGPINVVINTLDRMKKSSGK